MTEKDVVRKVMAMRGWSQPKLAAEAGFKSQSNTQACSTIIKTVFAW